MLCTENIFCLLIVFKIAPIPFIMVRIPQYEVVIFSKTCGKFIQVQRVSKLSKATESVADRKIICSWKYYCFLKHAFCQFLFPFQRRPAMIRKTHMSEFYGVWFLWCKFYTVMFTVIWSEVSIYKSNYVCWSACESPCFQNIWKHFLFTGFLVR